MILVNSKLFHIMKEVFTGHDVTALTYELQFLEGARLANVYDIESGMICLKLVKDIMDNDTPVVNDDGVKQKIKKYLVIHSGQKFYSKDTEFTALRKMPSSFCAKLRIHLNNKRISSFKQIRMDRVVDITFGTDEHAYHLICEFYASGNIILTDKDYKILILIHPHTYKDEDDRIKVKVNNIYPKEYATSDIENLKIDSSLLYEWINNNKIELQKKQTLKQFLTRSPIATYGPVIVEHALLSIDINPKQKINKDTLFDTIIPNSKMTSLIDLCRNLYVLDRNYKGYLILNENSDYDNVIPYLYKQFEDSQYILYDTFDEAVSLYFSKKDNLKTEKPKEMPKIQIVKDKNDRVEDNIKNQIDKINEKHIEEQKNICNIEDYVDKLDYMLYICKSNNTYDAIDIIKNNEIDVEIVNVEQHKNIVVFKYHNVEYVWNLDKTAYANLRDMYASKKQLIKKVERAETVLDTIKKSNKKVKTINETWKSIEIVGKKKELWYEQFVWFISSDGYLVICGKTATQNETIVGKYFDKNDVYVHSDVAGSGSCIIKNKSDQPIPPKTLEEAGACVVCNTKAWKERASDQTWWVTKDQVSKTAPTGEYVGKGSFIIRGKKNYMTKPNLRLGLTLMFKVKNKPDLVSSADKDIEYCIPMCAPYSAINDYKFKVKIVPGNAKINKVLKSIENMFFAIANDHEKAAIKKIIIDDYHRVLVSGIEIIK